MFRPSHLALPFLLLLTTPAIAAGPVTADAFHHARALAKADGIDIPEDVVVQRALSHLTTRGEAFMRRGLDRRDDWAPLVDRAIEDAGLPPLIAAVPLIESGYSNWGAPDSREVSSASPGTIPGRGLWMFIPETARLYGMKVNARTDDRLDPERETEAAMALLTDLHDRYNDWGLALAAYNQGSRAVDAAIEAGESRDVLRLIEAGHLNPYAARVMAGALLLADPGLLDGPSR